MNTFLNVEISIGHNPNSPPLGAFMIDPIDINDTLTYACQNTEPLIIIFFEIDIIILIILYIIKISK